MSLNNPFFFNPSLNNISVTLLSQAPDTLTTIFLLYLWLCCAHRCVWPYSCLESARACVHFYTVCTTFKSHRGHHQTPHKARCWTRVPQLKNSSDKYKKGYRAFSGVWSKSRNQQDHHSSAHFCLSAWLNMIFSSQWICLLAKNQSHFTLFCPGWPWLDPFCPALPRSALLSPA